MYQITQVDLNLVVFTQALRSDWRLQGFVMFGIPVSRIQGFGVPGFPVARIDPRKMVSALGQTPIFLKDPFPTTMHATHIHTATRAHTHTHTHTHTRAHPHPHPHAHARTHTHAHAFTEQAGNMDFGDL